MLRELLAIFGLEIEAETLTDAFESVGDLRDGLERLGETFTDNALVNGITFLIESMSELAFEVNNIAVQIDQSTDQVQQWGLLFGQVGLELDDVGDVFSTLSERARDARESDDVAAMFRSIGVATEDANGNLRTSEELFRDVVAGFGDLENATDATGLALTLFGDPGRRLLPILRDGSASLEEMAERFERLGGGISEEALGAFDDFQGATADLEFSMRSLGSRLAVFVVPIVTRLTEIATDLAAEFFELTDGTNILEAAFIALGVVSAVWAVNSLIAFLPLIGTVLLVAAVVGVLTLLFDDLITLWEGGDSVIGDLLDSLFGAGTSVAVVRRIRQAWADLSEFWGDVFDGTSTAWADLGRSFEFVAEATTDAIAAFWADLVRTVEFLWEGFVGFLNESIVEPITGAFSGLADTVGDLWQGLVDFLGGLWDGFVGGVLGGVGTVLGGIGDIAGAVGLEGIAESIQSATATLTGSDGGGGSTAAVMAAAPTNQRTQQTVIQQSNRFEARGADPQEVTRQIGEQMRRANADMARELQDQSRRAV